MKKFFLFTVFMFIAAAGFAQDIITYIQGAKIEAIVTRVTRTQIQFRLFTEPRGKEYFVYTRDIANIKYRDGRVETFNPTVEQRTEIAPRVNENQQNRNSNTNNQHSEQRTINNPRANENQQIATSNTNQTINNRNQASDIILMRDGTKRLVAVLEITPNVVKFRDYDNSTGLIYAFDKSDVASITYQDGRVESFNQYTEQRTDNTPGTNANQQFGSSNTNQIINNRNQTSDVILFRNGTRRMVAVLEITPDAVRYRDYDNPNGAVYTINQSDISRIIFQNGREETFAPATNPLQYSGWTGRTYLDGIRLSNKEIKNLFQGTNAMTQYNKSKLYNGLGNGMIVLGGVGLIGGMIGYYNYSEGNDTGFRFSYDETMTIFVVSGIVLTGGYVFKFISIGNKRRAVGLYNQTLKRRNDLSMNVGFMGNGLGLSVTF